MKRRFPWVTLLLLITSAPAVYAQSASYSFDNFDTANGVRVYAQPAVVQLPATRTGPRSRRPISNTSEEVSSIRPIIQPTNLSLNSLTNVSGVAISLRGFTTGNAQIDGYLTDSATRNGLDPLLLYSVMHQESSFKQRAISPKGARGLMQLMPGTAARYGVTNIFDPKQNIEGGARYMKFLLNRFDGNLSLALAGYNAGEGAVDKYGWRIPPYAETQEYVRRISRRYNLLRDPTRLCTHQACHARNWQSST